MDENIQTTATSRDFARDLQSMLQEAEALLKNAGQRLGSEYRTARERVTSSVNTSLSDARQSLTSAEDSVLNSARDAARTSDDFVQEHPWQAVVAGAVLGFLIGMVVARK